MNTTAFSLIAQAIGWAVLHSLWQIALIWLIFKTMSLIFRGKNQVIYLLSLGSMLAATLWITATFRSQYADISFAAQQASFVENLSAAPEWTNPVAPVTTDLWEPSLLENLQSWLETHAAQVGWAWGICVVLLWLRLLGGWWMVQRLRRRDVSTPDTAFQESCHALAKKLNIKRLVALLESPHVTEPLTIGFWKPLVLFPTGMLLSLSPAQVEALLLHELAHIRRYDYLINLFQLALETCFFYHPLFWLISRDARVRREFCCDDVVLYHTSDPILYAQTLTNLQISLLHPTTQFTMNATGKSCFTERILRIAGISPKRESRPGLFIIMLLPTILALGSWWPTQANTMPSESAIVSEQVVALDTLPPQKAAQPTPNTEHPKQEAIGVQPSDQVFSDHPVLTNTAPKVAMEAVKMNVFYIGVDNPLRVAVDGIPSSELILRIDGDGTITGADGNYNVTVKTPGEATVTVLRKVDGQETVINAQKYRVKRIPDLTPELNPSGARGGAITKEALLANSGLIALLENFDFDAVCNIVGYEMTLLIKDGDAISMNVKGADIPDSFREQLSKVSGNGDAVFFDDIKVKCPGDAAARNIGGLTFKLKPAE